MAELYCHRCGIQLERGNVIEMMGKRKLLCRPCESSEAEAKWIIFLFFVAVALLAGGAVCELWLSR